MKRFTTKAKFTEQEAIEDKIEVTIGRWTFRSPSEEAFGLLKNHLAVPPKDQKGTLLLKEKLQPFGTLFCRPANMTVEAYRLPILSQKLRSKDGLFMPPLCKGHLHFKVPSHSPLIVTAELRLDLNLLRYIRHQPANDDNPPADALSCKPRLRKRRQDRRTQGEEVALQEDDNWIPNTPAWRRFVRSCSQQWHFEQYLGKVLNRVESEIARASAHVRLQVPLKVSREPYYSLRKVETVWEFASNNPIRDTKIIEEQASKLRPGKVVVYPYKVIDRGRHQNSPSVHINLRRDCSLRVYAKTNRRVRFEIIQDNITDHRAKLLAFVAQASPAKTHVSPFDELPILMSAVRKKATGLVNEYCSALDDAYGGHPTPCSPLDLLSLVMCAIPPYSGSKERGEAVSQVVSCLVDSAGWKGGLPSSGSLFGRILAHLKDCDVIAYSRSVGGYILRPRYRAAIRELAGLESKYFKAVSRPRLIRDR